MPIFFSRSDGIHNRNAKLTPALVRKIRKDYANGKRGKTEARKLRVSESTYNNCGRRITWKSVE
jgi:hypothetical protein